MKDVTPEERWAIQLVQAENFALRENFSEAVVRARRVLRDVESALRTEVDGSRRRQLERLRTQAAGRTQAFQAQYDAWNQALLERREATIQSAEAQMSAPLPVPPPAMDRPGSR